MATSVITNPIGGGGINVDGEDVDLSRIEFIYSKTDNISLDDLPTGFDGPSVVTLNNKIHALGSRNGSSLHKQWEGGETWVSKPALPISLAARACVVVVNEEIHIFSGTLHYKWSEGDNAWTQLENTPINAPSDAVVLNNEIHLLGSITSGYYKMHYKWNGTTWTSVSSLPYDFRHGGAVVIDNEIHLLGGYSSSTDDGTSIHYKWDGKTWTSSYALPVITSRYDRPKRIVLNNEIYYDSNGMLYKGGNTPWTKVVSSSVSNFNGQISLTVLNGQIHEIGDHSSINHSKIVNQYNLVIK